MPQEKCEEDRVPRVLRELQWELFELEYANGIETRRWPLTALEFLRDYVARNKPIILTSLSTSRANMRETALLDCVDSWPCFRKWTPTYLSSLLKTKIFPVALTPHGQADSVTVACNDPLFAVIVAHHDCTGDDKGRPVECFAEPYEEHMSFNDFADMLGNKATTCIPYLQHQNDSLRSLFPELCADVEADGPMWAQEAFGCKADAVNLWIGDERSVTSFHKDHYENIYLVVEGTKEFILLPPCASNRLHFQSYPHARYVPNASGHLIPVLTKPSSLVEWSPVKPDGQETERWPMFHSDSYPPPLKCTLHKGEILYLPSLWYHHVTQHNKGNWVIAVNYWYDMQFDTKYAHHELIKKLS